MLDHQQFLIKQKVKFLSTHNSYDIYDGESQSQESIGRAEEIIPSWVRFGRWFISKALMPTRIEIREGPDDALLFTISRGWYIFRARVEIHDAQDELIGYFRSKVMTIGGGFYVYDRNDTEFANVSGNFIGFNYRITTPDRAVELGTVSKKWTSLAKEFFTSADTYKVEISEDLDDQPMAKMLVLAAALAVDMIFKSESRTVNFGE